MGLVIGITVTVVAVLIACTVAASLALSSLASTSAGQRLPTVTLATATSAPTATATPVRTVIYQNTFASNAEGWENDTADCFLKADGYHIKNGYECYAPIGAQTNVDVSVRVQQVSGDTSLPYGVVFGLDSQNNDYEFMIVGDSAWTLFRCGAKSCTPAVDYTENNAILGGLHTSNRLEVLVQGTHFQFYVNGTEVGSYDDTSYASGRVGIAAGDSSIECVFTNFVVSRP